MDESWLSLDKHDNMWQKLMFVPSNDWVYKHVWLDIVNFAGNWPIWAPIPMDT